MGDPLDDFFIHQGELDEAEDKRPHCCYCEQAIWSDKAYRIEGKLFCRDCMEYLFAEWSDDSKLRCPVCAREYGDLWYRIDGMLLCEECLEEYEEDLD